MNHKTFLRSPGQLSIQQNREKHTTQKIDISSKLLYKADDKHLITYFSKQFLKTPQNKQKRNKSIEGILQNSQQLDKFNKNSLTYLNSVSQTKRTKAQKKSCHYSKDRIVTNFEQKNKKNGGKSDLENFDPDTGRKKCENHSYVNKFQNIDVEKLQNRHLQEQIKQLILQIMKKNIIPFIIEKLEQFETKFQRQIQKFQKSIFKLSQQQKCQHFQLKQIVPICQQIKDIPKISQELSRNSKDIRAFQKQLNLMKEQLEHKFQKLEENQSFSQLGKLKSLMLLSKSDQKSTQRKNGDNNDKKQQGIQKIEKIIKVYNENFVQIQKRLSKIEQYSKKFQQELSLNSLEISSYNESSL